MLVAPKKQMDGKLVAGICGQVDGSIIPGMYGLEAGQSAFGDTYAWFRSLLSWPLNSLLSESKIIDKATADKLKDELEGQMIERLSLEAAKLPLEVTDEIAIDWLNGRRTPDANQLLKAGIAGLNLASDAPRIFKSLVEATCFGAKAIVDRFVAQGVPVKGLIGLGGVAKKSPYIMQTMADVMGMPIKIHKSEQTCARGAAMFAATAAGLYPMVEEAMEAMGQGFDVEYHPDSKKHAVHLQRYEKFKALGYFIETNLTATNA
jgi:L-ribulokinase